MKNKAPIIFLMLICSSANAAMYSCADENGTKILRSYPCEKNEKQQAIVKEVEPSHTIINSTGERQSYRSRSQEEINAAVHRDIGLANSKGYKELLDHCNAGIDRAMDAVNRGSRDNRSYRLRAMAPMMQSACSQNSGSLQGDKEKNDYCNAVTSMVTNIVNGGHKDNRSGNLAAMAPVMQAACEQNNNSAMTQPDIQAPAPHIQSDAPVFIPAPPSTPSIITNCDAGGCWDNLGGRYNKGGGNTYFPTSGGACQMVGGMMHCP